MEATDEGVTVAGLAAAAAEEKEEPGQPALEEKKPEE